VIMLVLLAVVLIFLIQQSFSEVCIVLFKQHFSPFCVYGNCADAEA
jgi:hypothetical protein